MGYLAQSSLAEEPQPGLMIGPACRVSPTPRGQEALPNIHLCWLYGWFGRLRADRQVMAGQRARMPAHRALRALPGRRPERYRGEAGQQPACTGNPLRGRCRPPPAGPRKHRCQETGRCGCADSSVVSGAGSMSAISRRSPAAAAAPGCRRCSARWSRVGTRAPTGRFDQAAARPSGGPPDRPAPCRAGSQHMPAPEHWLHGKRHVPASTDL